MAVVFNFGETVFHILENVTSSEALRNIGVDPDEVYITCNGRLVTKDVLLESGKCYRIFPRIYGGKGGFGSMLRAIGAQIEKTTNREACRDLSGRRMRDVNYEKELRDWVAQKAEREREREKRRQERAQKRREVLAGNVKHHFDDPDYQSQRMKVLDQLEDALEQGLRKSVKSSTASASCSSASQLTNKRKNEEADEVPSAKKTCEWLGIDVDNLSGLDSDSDSSSDEKSDLSQSTTSEIATPQYNKPDHEKLNRENEIHQDEVVNPAQTTDNTNEQLTATSTVEENAEKAKHSLLSTLSEIPLKTEEKAIKAEEGPLNLEEFESMSDLEALGLDRLKSALSSLGLKCGGTLQQRVERLWSIKGKPLDQIDQKLFARPVKSKKK